MGQEIEKTAVNFLKIIIKANYSKEKSSLLSEASIEINTLLILIRLSKDLNFISKRQYEFVAFKINEISKMLGGWLKYELKYERDKR